ncbi:MAG: GntR family transcriptional regulator [Chloroflexi bacterium]|nr:GntR family transcriptional regulator [Chloroflexota bacterium]
MTEQLRDAILSGQFPPGATLNQRDIADQLSVSRMPVREAFRALELEGLIRGLPRRKAVVVTLQPEDVADIYDILATLEGRAAERATPLHDTASVERVRTVLADLNASPDDPTRLLDLDDQLHLEIYQAQRTRSTLVIQTHRNALRTQLISTGLVVERRRAAEAEHALIVTALEARDAGEAGRQTVAHLQAEGRELVERLMGHAS